jgi:hypothetical protein
MIMYNEWSRCVHGSSNNAVHTSEYKAANVRMIKVEGTASPVTGRGGPQGCETSRLPYFLNNRLTNDSEVVSLRRRPPFNPRKIPGTHFC